MTASTFLLILALGLLSIFYNLVSARRRKAYNSQRIREILESSRRSSSSSSSKPLWVLTIQDRVERRRKEFLRGR